MNQPACTFAVVACVLACSGFSPTCENEVAANVSSPAGNSKIIVFSRNCGATTGLNTQVSILRGDEKLPNESGNTLILDGQIPIQVTWKSESTATLKGLSGTKPFIRERTVKGVEVSYE